MLETKAENETRTVNCTETIRKELHSARYHGFHKISITFGSEDSGIQCNTLLSSSSNFLLVELDLYTYGQYPPRKLIEVLYLYSP